MSNSAPLWVFVPNMLVPQAALQRLGQPQRQQLFNGLPAGLRQTMARAAHADYLPAGTLDRVEAWLLRHLDCAGVAKFDQYPAWAMMNAADDTKPYTRFVGSVGSLEVERDGVRFWPAEALEITDGELQAFWDCVSPLLAQHDWQARQIASTEGALGAHAMLTGGSPVPMEQASPWSVQTVRLTDYLPMSEDCATWRRMWLNMQVELHNAPFNAAREQQGKKPLNALWFWGGGYPWQTSVGFPNIKRVTADGVHNMAEAPTHGEADEAFVRLSFWNSLLNHLPQAENALHSDGKPSTVYVVDFAGWGSSTTVFDVLEQEVLHPMRMAGLAHAWSLLGQDGWLNLSSNWINRFKFWKNSPNLELLGEPEPADLPSEEDLQAAWAQGQADQDRISAEWNTSGERR
ncbi:hypothetical protein [Limnobacter sp.]|uniref:hypothetical protein n=1 Tax=Limnobacter sp. TaxID=2003368 RepID=UPI0035161C06